MQQSNKITIKDAPALVWRIVGIAVQSGRSGLIKLINFDTRDCD